MSDISEWSTKEPENTHLDELTLSGEGGRYINKIMCAVKEKMDEVDGKLAKVQGAYVFKGTKATVADLPATGNETGDIWNVTALGGGDYAWTGEAWDALGPGEAASTYCADCNAALTPGRYYIDENTLNSPDGTPGILKVEGKGGASDDVWQQAITTRNGSAYTLIVYRRRVVVSSGSFSSAWPWNGTEIIPSSNMYKTFRESAESAVFCPPAGQKLTGQNASIYEFIRLYHTRDASRDSSYSSHGLVSRSVANKAPTSGDYVENNFAVGSVEGGISSPCFNLKASVRCASVVTYTDTTSETIYGKYIKEGDVVEGKTVDSVEYTRTASSGEISYDIDSVINLGNSSKKFNTLYAATGSINTSDERLKEFVEKIPDAVLDAWGEVGWVQFQFKSALAKKGSEARLHSGLIAQRIDEVFKARGLDASRYGLFCYDIWEDEWDEDEVGVQRKIQEAGDIYSLRYEEALAMEAAYQRRRADRLEARIEALEALVNGHD